MAAARFTTFQLGLMLATAMSVSMLSSAGQAYTPEQQQACTGDAFRLCSSEIPDVDKVTVCMVRNKSQLSPGCRVFFHDGGAEAAGKPADIKPAMARKPFRKMRKHAKPDDT